MSKKQMSREERKEYFKQKFIKALRSGRYKKIETRCSLNVGDGKVCYCAVGVFGKVARIPGAPSQEFDEKSYRALESIFEIETAEIFGRNDGWDGYGGKPWSFKEIADWVEANV